MIIGELCEENMKLLEKNKDYRSQKAVSLINTKGGFYDTQQEFRMGDPKIDIESLQKISKS
jgi:hypothetical protein